MLRLNGVSVEFGCHEREVLRKEASIVNNMETDSSLESQKRFRKEGSLVEGYWGVSVCALDALSWDHGLYPNPELNSGPNLRKRVLEMHQSPNPNPQNAHPETQSPINPKP